MQKAEDDFTPQVGRGQRGDQRLPETAETHVGWLITQRRQLLNAAWATGSNPVAPTGAEQQRRCLTCGNAVGHRLLLSGWLRLFTADADWLRPIRAQVSQRHRRRCPQRRR